MLPDGLARNGTLIDLLLRLSTNSQCRFDREQAPSQARNLQLSIPARRRHRTGLTFPTLSGVDSALAKL